MPPGSLIRSPITKAPTRLPAACLSLLVVLGLSGCGGVSTRFVTGLTPEQRAEADRLPVYEESLAEGAFKDLGQVRGLSCQVTADSQFNVSEDNAMTELRRAAVREGGDAVMDASCRRLARGQGRSNCFSAIECTGTAVILDATTRQ